MMDKTIFIKTVYGTKVEFLGFHDDDLISINHFGYKLEILLEDLDENSKILLEELKKNLTKI